MDDKKKIIQPKRRSLFGGRLDPEPEVAPESLPKPKSPPPPDPLPPHQTVSQPVAPIVYTPAPAKAPPPEDPIAVKVLKDLCKYAGEGRTVGLHELQVALRKVEGK